MTTAIDPSKSREGLHYEECNETLSKDVVEYIVTGADGHSSFFSVQHKKSKMDDLAEIIKFAVPPVRVERATYIAGGLNCQRTKRELYIYDPDEWDESKNPEFRADVAADVAYGFPITVAAALVGVDDGRIRAWIRGRPDLYAIYKARKDEKGDE